MNTSRVLRACFLGPLLAALALPAAGCGLIEPDWSEEEEALRDARALWETQDIQDYTLRFVNECYCGYGGVPVIVDVAAGEVVRVRVEETGEELAEWERTSSFRPVDELFDELEGALDRGPADYRARFHPTLGYPEEVAVDPIENAVDEEFGWQADVTVGG